MAGRLEYSSRGGGVVGADHKPELEVAEVQAGGNRLWVSAPSLGDGASGPGWSGERDRNVDARAYELLAHYRDWVAERTRAPD